MLKPILTCATALALLAGSAASSSAQFFNPATSTFESTFPGSNKLGKPSSTSCYSMTNVFTGFGNVDLFISGWSDGSSGDLVWRMSVPNNPSAMLAEDHFNYSGVTDMEVGFVNDVSGTQLVLVAYYRNGVGHFMDIYKVTGSPSTPLAYSSTMMLSNSTKYGRIRMDSHKTYGVAVAWQYPGIGIQTIVGNSGSWSSPTTLLGTAKETGPDVAFSHSTGPLNVHYAYHDKGNGTITESVIDWNVLLTSPPTYSPTIEDINSIPVTKEDLRLVLDCPDHYNVENWAYTYTVDHSNISVRFIDYHSTGVPTTVDVNSGALGNAPTVGNYKSYAPALFYGDGNTEQIIVGWYTTDGGAYNGYIGLQMKENGGGIVSAPDYSELMNAATGIFYPSPLRPGVAFSKLSDWGLAPNTLYHTYYDFNGAFDYHHGFFKWGSPVFKNGNVYHPECGSEAAGLTAKNAGMINVYPNPFTDVVSTTFELQEAGTVKLQLLDLTGRIVAQTSSQAEKGTHRFSTGTLQQLAAGPYLLQVSLNGRNVGQQKVVKH